MITSLQIGQLSVKWRSIIYYLYFVHRKIGVQWVIGLFRNSMRFVHIVCGSCLTSALCASHLGNEGVGWSDLTPTICSLR